MSFATELTNVYKTKWAFINTFRVQFAFSKYIKDNAGWSTDDELGIDIFVKSVNTPQHTNQSIEAYVCDSWKIHNGRNELWKFTVGFRDHDQLKLYRKFIKSYELQRAQYFDDIKMSITIWKDEDYSDETALPLFQFDNAMIEAVSSIQFSNETEAQIAEFDVEFKSTDARILNYR